MLKWAHASPAVMRGYYRTHTSNHITCACVLRWPYDGAGVGVGPPYFEAFCIQLNASWPDISVTRCLHIVLNRLIDTTIMTYQKYYGKIMHFFVLPCGTCEAFSLLGIAILCSGSGNFCFETMLHSLIPLCGKIKDSSLMLGTSKIWAGPKIYKIEPSDVKIRILNV